MQPTFPPSVVPWQNTQHYTWLLQWGDLHTCRATAVTLEQYFHSTKLNADLFLPSPHVLLPTKGHLQTKWDWVFEEDNLMQVWFGIHLYLLLTSSVSSICVSIEKKKVKICPGHHPKPLKHAFTEGCRQGFSLLSSILQSYIQHYTFFQIDTITASCPIH